MIKIKKTNIYEVAAIAKKSWLIERPNEVEYKKVKEAQENIEGHVNEIREIYIQKMFLQT
ncbi:hypothetical protein [Brevibacillus laterosporus]|uniref:hypothetical protein n=1 Tax=Brevibacillus laterosporus TaxID=1465 RepID=UPI000E6BA1A7|nr:hypothetical protein [Brevibacillus laterosporus]AYB37602.1 hypothetical protein D5F52_04510 [Brevibacillus laterosporus]MBM7110843.1 hypothetical protein [Brevibacillus laterosporus]